MQLLSHIKSKAKELLFGQDHERQSKVLIPSCFMMKRRRMSWFSNVVSAPLRAVAAIVDAVDSEDILGIAQAAENAADSVKSAIEYIEGE